MGTVFQRQTVFPIRLSGGLDDALHKEQGLTIVLIVAFIGSLLGMWLSGWRQENLDLVKHGMPKILLVAYSSDESFLSALFENWESEWLQMVAYVMLTAILFQKGSAESRDPG